MAILVTGGAGYIGSHTALALLDAGEDIIVLDDLSTGQPFLIPPHARHYHGDVGDRALVQRLFASHPIEAVIHFAGSIVVPDSVADPLRYYENNTAKSRSLIEQTITAGVKSFIFSSTAAVYGAAGARALDETSELRPESPYGWSKRMTEIMLADAARAHDFRYVALRYFNVAGADPSLRAGQSSHRATHLIKIACQVATGARPFMEVYGEDYSTPDGTCMRDYIHVSDLAAAHAAALRYLRKDGASDVFNCGIGLGYSVREVIAAVTRVCGAELDVRPAPRRAGDPPVLVANADKLRARLGWSPLYPELEVMVTHALAWERKLDGLLKAPGQRP